MKECPKCKIMLSDNAKFCFRCRLDFANNRLSGKSVSTIEREKVDENFSYIELMKRRNKKNNSNIASISELVNENENDTLTTDNDVEEIHTQQPDEKIEQNVDEIFQFEPIEDMIPEQPVKKVATTENSVKNTDNNEIVTDYSSVANNNQDNQNTLNDIENYTNTETYTENTSTNNESYVDNTYIPNDESYTNNYTDNTTDYNTNDVNEDYTYQNNVNAETYTDNTYTTNENYGDNTYVENNYTPDVNQYEIQDSYPDNQYGENYPEGYNYEYTENIQEKTKFDRANDLKFDNAENQQPDENFEFETVAENTEEEKDDKIHFFDSIYKTGIALSIISIFTFILLMYVNKDISFIAFEISLYIIGFNIFMTVIKIIAKLFRD